MFEIISVTLPAWLYYAMSLTFAGTVSVIVMLTLKAIDRPRPKRMK